MGSLKLRHHHSQHQPEDLPLLNQTQVTNKSPNNQSVLSNDSSNNIVPTIVIENSISPATTPTAAAPPPSHDSKTDYYKNRKEFFNSQGQSKV